MAAGAATASLTRDWRSIVEQGPLVGDASEALVYAAPTLVAAALSSLISNAKWVHKAVGSLLHSFIHSLHTHNLTRLSIVQGLLELLFTYVSGASFGLGLIISEMRSSAKVRASMYLASSVSVSYSILGRRISGLRQPCLWLGLLPYRRNGWRSAAEPLHIFLHEQC